MQLDMNEFVLLARIVKAAQAEDTESKKKLRKDKKDKSTRPTLTHVYPDYSKSIVSQQRKSPHAAGLRRSLGAGLTGSVLGALLARLLSNNPKAVIGGAVGGGLLGGIPGYISGSEEAKSDYTKLLALRRMGIQTPAEYEQSLMFPGVVDRLTTKGIRI